MARSYAQARELCAGCYPPDVAVACQDDVCTGWMDPLARPPRPGVSHCGEDGVDPPVTGVSGTSHFTCDGPDS